MHKKEVVLNSVAEFLGIWAVRGEASLSLKTKDLRDSGRSILDTLSVSPVNSRREEMEDEDDSIHDSKPEYPPWWKEEDEDWSVIETQRISDEMGSTGKCYFCDFSCEPGDSLWYNPPLIDHREEPHHPESGFDSCLSISIRAQ